MKITLYDGKTMNLPLNIYNCAGYAAKAIEIEPSDVQEMRRMLKDNPRELNVMLIQLEARLNRAHAINHWKENTDVR